LLLLLNFRKGTAVKSILLIPIIVFFALAPSTLVAQTPVINAPVGDSRTEFEYSKFALSKNDETEIMRSVDASCPKQSDDDGSVLSAEPRYQTACRNKQVAQIQKRLDRAYKSAMRDLSQKVKGEYRAEYLGWVKTRYAACQRDRKENLGGALKNVVFSNCQLLELKRRTKWQGAPA
jgi:uncharacterized protein YecT (DUF1311 family)